MITNPSVFQNSTYLKSQYRVQTNKQDVSWYTEGRPSAFDDQRH